MAAAPGDGGEKAPRGRAAPRPMFPQPVAPAGIPGPAYGAGRRRPRPRHVRTIFQAAAEPPHRFGPAAAAGTWCDLCCRFVLSQGLRCADCKYTCHAHCRDLVHLGCRRNGKLMDCLAPHDTLDPSYNNGQVHLQHCLLRELNCSFKKKASPSCQLPV
ncbi:ras association domain-containing protein 5-like [Chroicocephalus ridibundus]